MQKDGRDVDSGNGPNWPKIGAGLVVGGGMLAATTGVIAESTGILLVGVGILGLGIIIIAASGGSAGDSGGGLGAGSGGEAGGGETGGGETGCFTASTLVLLADGEKKPIETVKAGDYVISCEETTGTTRPQRVQRLWTHQVPTTLVLQLTGGEKVETTREHRFFVADRGFVGAGRLASGSTLKNYYGQNLQVTALEPSVQTVKVYNLEVENFHTYFVGNGGLWVHNRKESDPFEGD
jgi:Pretoxin HINT domain